MWAARKISAVLTTACLTVFTLENIARPVRLAGESMEPNFKADDIVLSVAVNKTTLKHGDVVISTSPSDPERGICKRIAGLVRLHTL